VAIKKYKKTDGTVTVKGDDGKIATNLPNPDALEQLKLDSEKIVSTLVDENVEESENDERSTREIRSDLRTATKASEFVGEVLDIGLDAVETLDEKIAELEQERQQYRITADAENRPLTADEIARAKEITDSINEVRKRKRELIGHTKDIRLTKADADLKKYQEEIALEEAQGKKLVLDYEGEALGLAVQTGEFEADSPEWHEQRKKVIGGSDVGIIMGSSPFQTENRLLATKLGLIDTNFKSTAASLGDIYEPIIQHEFAKRHAKGNDEGKPIFTVYHTKASWRSTEKENHGANFDGLYDSTGKGGAPDSILEIKAVSDASKWEGGPPLHYRQQVLWYMSVTGLRKGTIAVLINQNEYREYPIEPKEGEIEEVVAKVDAFEKRLAAEAKKVAKILKK
jgi:putative phage-type endonuclease